MIDSDRPTIMRGTLTAFALAAGLASTARGAESPRRVIILSGTDIMLPASLVLDGAIRQTLASPRAGPIEVFSEALDAFRFQSAAFEPELVGFFERKYRDRPPSVVVALSEEAFGFVIRHRDRLWPGSPVVFSSVSPEFMAGQTVPEWSSGIYEGVDAAGTLDLIARLQPDVRRIVVVAGVAEQDATVVAHVLGEAERFRSRFDIAVRRGIPISQLRQEVGALTSDSAVLFTSVHRDSSGAVWVPREFLEWLAAASSVPVYGLYSTYLGHGTVGGALHDFEVEGRHTGQLVLRILDGARPSSMRPQTRAPSLLAVDARVLERFGIPVRRVPSGVDLRFYTPPFWVLYRGRIVAVAVAFALQTALLVALLVSRRQRRDAQADSRLRRRELAHAGRLSAVGELTASISHEINQPLGAILANAEVAEVLLEAGPAQIGEVRQILADIRRDDLRASEVVRRVRRLVVDGDVAMKPVDLNDAVGAAVRMLEHEAGRRRVVLEKSFAPGLPPSRADEVAIQQVVINLALNGMDAMSEMPADRRRLRVLTRAENGQIAVRVSDEGRGIAEQEQPRLFQPFFTTKEQGVGLGLSICRLIVEAHGGTLRGFNNPGAGATFEFELPVVSPGAAPVQNDRVRLA